MCAKAIIKEEATSIVKTFDSDLKELSNLLNEAFLKDYGKGKFFEFSQEYLEWLISNPAINPEFVIGAYNKKNNRLIGFQMAIPMKFSIGPNKLYSLVCTFLATHPDFRKQRIGYRVIKENYLRALNNNVDFLFNFQLKPVMDWYKNPKQGVFEYKKYQLIGKILFLPDIKAIKNKYWLMGLFFKLWSFTYKPFYLLRFSPHYSVRRGKLKDFEMCFNILREIQKTKPKIWDRNELKHQLFSNFTHSYLLLDRHNRIVAILNLYFLNLFGFPKNKVGIIDFFECKIDLGNGVKSYFLLRIEQILERHNVTALIKYASSQREAKPFLNSGFVAHPSKKFILYYKNLSNKFSIGDLEGIEISLR